jgi:hypothetical protein
MDEEMRDPKGNVDDFLAEFKKNLDDPEIRRIHEEDKILHIEDRLYDKIIVYMGDKATERIGKKDDLMEIAVLSYLIWSKK